VEGALVPVLTKGVCSADKTGRGGAGAVIGVCAKLRVLRPSLIS